MSGAVEPPDGVGGLDGVGAVEGVDGAERTEVALAALVGVVDQLASRRPVAARLVQMTGDSAVGSAELAAVLVSDVALTARVTRLANSTFYGLSGRVRTVPFAVTVVGFAAVRAMAATAAAGAGTDGVLPEDVWARSEAAALACGELAPLFGVPAADAFCLGLLAGLGRAVLAHHDPAATRAVLEDDGVRAGGRRALVAAERAAHGVCHTEVSAAALAAWHFPADLTGALEAVDAPPAAGLRSTPWSRCLATALEAVERAASPRAERQDAAHLSGGAVDEQRLSALAARLLLAPPRPPAA